jgi:NAD(P)-dependent dehydrogenase (short-subunit alcohol dehydrogenase family)
MNIDLSGRTALVSGSTKGIGRAIAAGLAGSGADVVINGRDEDGAARVFAEVPDVDILVNNLGVYGPSPALEISDDEWRRYFEVNVLSGVRLTRHYLPGMMSRGWGRVQFIASDSAVVIPDEMVHYGMTKTALLAVARGHAKAAAGTGVTVNTVIAGPTHTEGVEEFVTSLVGSDLPWEEAQRRFMAEHRPNSLIQRLIEPIEIANMVVYLSSDQASATTGGALRVDGGYVDSILP